MVGVGLSRLPRVQPFSWALKETMNDQDDGDDDDGGGGDGGETVEAFKKQHEELNEELFQYRSVILQVVNYIS